MKTIRIFLLLACLLGVQVSTIRAQGISLASGATFSLGGATYFLPGNWANSGTINAGTSTIVFTGATGNQNFANSSATTFNNITINKAAGDVQLLNSITVNGALTCASGDLDLNANTVALGSSATLSETSGNTVKGGGTITLVPSPTLNAPLANPLNGIGATITSSANLGATTIARGHTQFSRGANNSILRYFDINPATNTSLNATLAFKYDRSELNGVTEANLVLFRSTDGGTTWSQAGGTVNTTTSTVTLSGINGFSRWTLASSSAPLSTPTTIASTNGNNQSGTISTALVNPFIVTVTDAGGGPVSGVGVTFAVTSAPSGATGQSLSITTASTNSSGQASSVLTLGNKVGQYTVMATSSGLSGSPVTFAATATVGAATAIVLTSGNNQSGAISTALASPYVVTVTDAGGNPVSGMPVTFAIVSVPSGAMGQLLTILTIPTNSSGQASTVLTLGNKPGAYTVTATSSGLSGSPVTFTATATVGSATTIALTSGNNQSGGISAALASPLVVTVTDGGGNPISGVTVSFAIASVPSGATGQSLGTATTTTNSSGQASSVLTLGNKVGQYTVTATSSGLSGSPVTFTATAATGTATTIALTSGNSQSGAISTVLGSPFVVTVTDAGGNPISSVSVSFAIASVPSGATGQSVSVTAAGTDNSGQVQTILTLGNKPGTYTVTATSSGLSGSPVTFTATATTGAASTIALTSGNNQSGAISMTLVNPFIVTVTDAGGNPVPGVTVNFAIAAVPNGATGQSLNTTTFITGTSGQAWSVLTLGNKAGTYTVTAASSGLSGSPITFAATATAGVATTIALVSGNNQSGPINTTLANPFVVIVTDAGGNPVSSLNVNFAVASTPTGATGQWLNSVASGASGQASSLFGLGNKAGTYTVTATSSGLSGSPVTFTATATNPAPTLSGIFANRAGRGSVMNVTLTGTNFLQGVTTVGFGPDITVNSQTLTSIIQIVANITISSSAATGGRDVTVTNASPGGGTATLTNGFTIDTSTPTSVESMLGAVPEQFMLYDAYPNPFNPSTRIAFSIPKTAFVQLKILDALGREVALLVNGERAAGNYEVQWDAGSHPSGIYFYRLQAGEFIGAKRMILLK